MAGWTFFTNHAHVLFCLARDPDIRVRDVAELVGVTERATLRIISELTADGYVHRVREGRRNRYLVHVDGLLRHPVERPHNVADLLLAVGEQGPTAAPLRPRRPHPGTGPPRRVLPPGTGSG